MLTEPLSVFFSAAGGFGTPATLNGAAVEGIFDHAWTPALGGMAETTAPTFMLPTDSVPASVHGLAMQIAGDAYTVVGAQHDGTGVTTLVLERA